MPLTHRQLCDIAAKWLRRPFGGRGHGCAVSVSECRIDGTGCGEIPDAIGFRFSRHRDGTVLVEAKTSRSDFLADQRKAHRASLGLGNFRYYLTPEGMVSLDELPPRWGLIEVNVRGHVRMVHGAAALMVRHGRETDAQIEAWRFESDRHAELSLLTRLMSRVGDAEALNRRLAELNSANSNMARHLDELQREARAIRTENFALRAVVEAAGLALPNRAARTRVIRHG